ncbi:MAG: hypothetical protein SF053_06865 [Bacteroidia bacterium]|jgi:phosphoglycerate-specific signal transduction histidine kinase|nr:hypothetical protein [Bacteroidia bacterium]
MDNPGEHTSPVPSSAPVDPLSQLSAIQHIIMGPTVSEIHQRINDLQRVVAHEDQQTLAQLQSLAADLQARISQEVSSLHARLDAIHADIQAELAQLRSASVDRQHLSRLLAGLADQLSDNANP